MVVTLEIKLLSELASVRLKRYKHLLLSPASLFNVFFGGLMKCIPFAGIIHTPRKMCLLVNGIL